VLRCGGAAVREERKGGARGGEEMVPPLYRAEREREGARLRRWAARSVAAINGGSVRWRRVGEGVEAVEWGRRECGGEAERRGEAGEAGRRGEAGGAGDGRRGQGSAAGGRG
jgi:hypothetical protein